jgi:hypothetical protein
MSLKSLAVQAFSREQGCEQNVNTDKKSCSFAVNTPKSASVVPSFGESEQSPRALTVWSERAADLIRWFQTRRAELPNVPFGLNPWTQVSDPALFYAGLDRDIAAGPKGPRAEALVDDLEQLFERWAIQNEDKE